MTKKPFLSTVFVLLIFCLPAAAAPRKASAQNHTVSQTAGTQTPSAEKKTLTGDGNLPESASALPLLSAVGAGALLGGLLSARRTRPNK